MSNNLAPIREFPIGHNIEKVKKMLCGQPLNLEDTSGNFHASSSLCQSFPSALSKSRAKYKDEEGKISYSDMDSNKPKI